MSSTNRGSVRTPNDYYLTDPKEIVKFLLAWLATDGMANRLFKCKDLSILDPAAGGLTERVEVPQKEGKPPLVFEPSEMSYPKAIRAVSGHAIHTMDIRENSLAAERTDFLQRLQPPYYDLAITNPPFLLALEFIKQSLTVVKPGGFVVMLLRLNFFGSEDRNSFFLSGNMPQRGYVHSKRLGFTPDGKTDSVEYAHFIWQKTDEPNHETKLRVLPYR